MMSRKKLKQKDARKRASIRYSIFEALIFSDKAQKHVILGPVRTTWMCC